VPLGARITLGLAPDSSIDFGEVRVNAVRAQSFIVENLGQATSSALEFFGSHALVCEMQDTRRRSPADTRVSACAPSRDARPFENQECAP
jgi:hypothetical protein